MTPNLVSILQRLCDRVVESSFFLCGSSGHGVVDLDAAFAGGSEDLGGRDGEGEDVGAVRGVDGVQGEVLFRLCGAGELLVVGLHMWRVGWIAAYHSELTRE